MSNRYRKFAVAIFTTVLVGLYYMYILPMSGVGKTTAKPGKAVEYEKRRESKPPLASSDLKQPVTPPKITESPISIDTPASLDPPTSTSALASTIHCVGDTFTPRAWAHRSCEFTNICFDRKKNDFVLFKPEDSIAHVHTPEALISSSSSYHLSVSLGGINPRWNWVDDGIHKLEWFPRIVDGVLNENYDRIEGTTLVPYHSMAGINIGHLIWDDFLPIYTLLSMFGLEETNLFFVRHVLQEPLWATCDKTELNKEKCRKSFEKWFPTMGGGVPITNETLHNQEPSTSNYLCFDRGVAGLGLLTDHGDKLHGWDKTDYEVSHNLGRGKILWDFRNHLLRNLKIDGLAKPKSNPRIITFSTLSSQSISRRLTFKNQIEALKQKFEEDEQEVEIKIVKFDEMSVEEQLKTAAESSVIVTAAGGGAMTAMFLPKGASLIIFYEDKQHYNKKNENPARLDWDYFNNAAYLRTHWFPITTMTETEDVNAFRSLVVHELDIISSHH